MSVYGRGQYSNGHDHNYFLHRNAKGTARPNDLIVLCGLHFAHFQFQVEEFVCKTRYIQQSSFEIISFLYLIVNAFDAKLNFSWVHHNGIQ